MVVLICISLMITDIEHLFLCAYWPFVYLWRSVYSSPLPIFELFFFLCGLVTEVEQFLNNVYSHFQPFYYENFKHGKSIV